MDYIHLFKVSAFPSSKEWPLSSSWFCFVCFLGSFHWEAYDKPFGGGGGDQLYHTQEAKLQGMSISHVMPTHKKKKNEKR